MPRLLTWGDIWGFCPYSRLLPESRPLGNKKSSLIVQHYMQTAWWGTALRLALRELR